MTLTCLFTHGQHDAHSFVPAEVERHVNANPGIQRVALRSGTFVLHAASCFAVLKHPPAVYQSESQLRWINWKKQRNEKIDNNVGVALKGHKENPNWNRF